MLKKLWRTYGPNPFDASLKRAKKEHKTRFLIYWNRGLGDLALGLYTLNLRIREWIPEAKITYLTRQDLADGFQLLEDVEVIVSPSLKRGQPLKLSEHLIDPSQFDVILEKPDPTRWLMWQLGKVTPRLKWEEKWNTAHQRFSFPRKSPLIGVHVQTETHYQYEKNWPVHYWQTFFKESFEKYGAYSLLFGFSKQVPFDQEGVIDLRGETTLFEMLSIIKNCCQFLLVPDSGVLSLTYYLNQAFPLHIVSIWADPKQGILKQKVASPNPLLHHYPLIAKNKDLSHLDVQQVIHALFKKGKTS